MDGPVPTKFTTQRTITRATRTFLLAHGSHMVPTSTLATAPNLAKPGSTPPTLHTLGVDAHSATLQVPPMTLGQTYTLPFAVGFANLASWGRSANNTVVSYPQPLTSTAKRDVVSYAKDTLLLRARLEAIEKNDSSLVVVSSSCIGHGNSGGLLFAGPVLPSGRAFRSFAAVGTVKLYAQQAYGGGSMTLHVSGELHVQPG